MNWLLTEEDIMQNKRSLIVGLSLMILVLFLVSCSQAYSTGQREREDETTLTSQPVKAEALVPTLEQIQYSFREVAQEALPVVVEINTIDVITQRIPRTQSPWDFFFGPSPDRGDSEEREFRQPGLGSGVIVHRTNGKIYVLTNNHVAGEAEEISISLHDGREFKGKLVGTDPRRDLAVVMFETREEIPIASLGDSNTLEVGDLVLAVGNPFGFESTITMGIISAVGREADLGTSVASLTDYIQTDASINPGNSGGALVNLRGEVVGINTWIASRTGSSAGLGFAVPINTAKKTVDEILTKGRVEYGWLGVQIVDVDPQRFPEYRDDFSQLPDTDYAHIANDMQRAYRRGGREQTFDIRLAIREEDKEIAAQSKGEKQALQGDAKENR